MEADLGSLSAFDYELPERLIAQSPLDRRDASRLMLLDRRRGEIESTVFSRLPELLREGDLLVVNDTRVIRARTFGHREHTGGAVEIFFLRPTDDPSIWEAFVRPGRKLRPGESVILEGGHRVEIASTAPDGARYVRLPDGANGWELLASCGHLPLPSYIKREIDDPERYQTVWADEMKARSVAAPTAGLHFTRETLDRLDRAGVEIARVTLDVGAGTFRPVKTEDISLHVMHSERCAISPEAARAVNEAKRGGRRVVAVGTTSVRTLESFAAPDGTVEPGSRDTDIFIRPGYRFKCVDALVTNFHLPKSTLIMLVAAFAGYELTMRAYREAVAGEWRLFSFGDAMFIE